MSTILEIDPRLIRPGFEQVLAEQGVAEINHLSAPARDALEQAFHDYDRQVQARAITDRVTRRRFSTIFKNAANDPQAPLQDIFPGGEELLVFVLTLGSDLSAAIESTLTSDIAHGYLLDAVASCAADNAVGYLEQQEYNDNRVSLAYSPGYCGWHITGQRALFAWLKPEQIGVIINEECLMQPLKSVSGVVVTGAPAIHHFHPGFTFCRECRTKSCLPRLRGLKNT